MMLSKGAVKIVVRSYDVSINMQQTGLRINYLMAINKITVRELQKIMRFESPQAIYNWLNGRALPKIDNLVILSRVLNVAIDDILVTNEPAGTDGQMRDSDDEEKPSGRDASDERS